MNKKSFKNAQNPALQFISSPTQEPVNNLTEIFKETLPMEINAPIPAKNNHFEAKSRRLQLLIKPSIFQKVQLIAQNQGLSINAYINQILDDIVK